MSGARTAIIATLISGSAAAILIVAAVCLRFRGAIGPHQQFAVVALVFAQGIIAVGVAGTFAVVLARGGGLRVVKQTAIVLALLLMSGLCTFEVLGLLMQNNSASSRLAALLEDVPFLAAVAIPGLVTIVIQGWLFVRPWPVGRRSAKASGDSASHQ
jgi:hypothetical protein